jgi:uridine phosphorylase
MSGVSRPRVDDPCYVLPASDFPRGAVTIPSRVGVLLFSGTLYDTVARSLDGAVEPAEWTNPRMPLVVTADGVAVHFPLYGSPRVAAAIEQLAYCGVDTLVGVGLCGALNRSLPIGSVVAPAGGIRGDAVSHHYLPPEYPAVPHRDLLEEIYDGLKDRWTVNSVIQFSTDALYRERRSEIDYWRQAGVSTIDMECAAFLTVARALGIKAAWVGVVSDLLDGEAHEGGIGGASVMSDAVQIAQRLIRSYGRRADKETR